MNFLVVYGFGLVGLVILIIGAYAARRITGAVAAGIAAGLCFATQWIILAALIGMGEAWSGDSGGSAFLHFLSLAFIFAFIVYCIFVWVRLDAKKRKSGSSHSPAEPAAFRYETGEIVRAGDHVRVDEETGIIAFVSDNEFGEFLPDYMDQRGCKRGIMLRKDSGEMSFHDQVPSSLQFIARTKAEA